MSRLQTAVTPGALATEGESRDAALLGLRTFLLSVGWFEAERRREQLGALSSAEVAKLVRDSADAAYASVLARMDEYRGQSRFAVWLAKFAIHETAAAARTSAVHQRKTCATGYTNAAATDGERVHD